MGQGGSGALASQRGAVLPGAEVKGVGVEEELGVGVELGDQLLHICSSEEEGTNMRFLLATLIAPDQGRGHGML